MPLFFERLARLLPARFRASTEGGAGPAAAAETPEAALAAAAAAEGGPVRPALPDDAPRKRGPLVDPPGLSDGQLASDLPPGRGAPARKRETPWETARTVLYAILIAVGVRTYLFEPFNIPSASMVPTLLIGDYLFVSKYSYGYNSRTLLLGFDLFDGRVLGSAPRRGDIVVFKVPEAPTLVGPRGSTNPLYQAVGVITDFLRLFGDSRPDYIKRVIGLPGDTIQMRAGRLFINGALVARQPAPVLHVDSAGFVVPTYVETLPDGQGGTVDHVIIEEKGDIGPLDNTLLYTVPPGHYFFMGDNRDNSNDSRALNHVGYVPEADLVGRAEILFFSLDEDTSIFEIWAVPFEIRYGRLLNWVGP